ncbi:MAG: hypothetical protein KA146_06225 [Leptospiraceae bacterium]|nr:hypothetical protein [Leptospiraceae bacterium]
MDNFTLNFIASIFLFGMALIGMLYTFTLIFEAITGHSHNRFKNQLRICKEINILQEKRIKDLKEKNNYLLDMISENREMGNKYLKRFINNWHNIKNKKDANNV